MTNIKSPIISIVIPIYNCEQYLAACLDSILSQTMTDIELICVDDQSTDNSGNILDSYAKQHDCIIAIHKQNGGVSAARNEALKHCSGQYIMFCDADDTFSPDMCKMMLEAAKATGCDMVRCGHKRQFSSREVVCPSPVEAKTYNKAKLIEHYLKNMVGPSCTVQLNQPSKYAANLWCHMIKRSIIADNDIRFPTSLFSGEDTMFVMECLLCCNSFASISDTLYNYYIHDGSAVRRYNPKIINNTYTYIDELDRLMQKYDLLEQTQLNRQFNKAKQANYLAEQIFNRNNPAPMKEKIALMNNALNDKRLIGCFDRLEPNELSLKIRVFYYCLMHKHYRTYYFLRNLRSWLSSKR